MKGYESLIKAIKGTRGKKFLAYHTSVAGLTDTLLKDIRKRDSYICQLCGALCTYKALDVHHIDSNRSNQDRNNLITLCQKCHKVVSVNKKKWKVILSIVNRFRFGSIGEKK
jgi:hypothetical protein